MTVLTCSHASFASIAGKAVSVSGDVAIKGVREPTSAKGHPLHPGDSVSAGEAIQSAANGSAKLMMTDQTIVDIAPSSRFGVDEYQLKNGADRKVSVSVDYGKIRALVNQPVSAAGKFNVHTKGATMGVRGTEFVVATELGSNSGAGGGSQEVRTQITVVKGTVEVIDPFGGRSIPLGAGKQLESQVQVRADGGVVKPPGGSAAGGGPRVSELSSAQVKAAASDARVTDTTFRQAVVVDNNTSTGSSSGGTAPPEAGSRPAGPPSVLATVQTSVAAAVDRPDGPPPPRGAPINAPGTFGGDNPPPPPPPPPVLQGQPVSLQILFTP